MALAVAFKDDGAKRQPMNARECNEVAQERRGWIGCEDNGLCERSIAAKFGGRDGSNAVRTGSLKSHDEMTSRVTAAKRGSTDGI